jgi:hypothetical protein
VPPSVTTSPRFSACGRSQLTWIEKLGGRRVFDLAVTNQRRGCPIPRALCEGWVRCCSQSWFDSCPKIVWHKQHRARPCKTARTWHPAFFRRCHPEHSRSSGGVKDLGLIRPGPDIPEREGHEFYSCRQVSRPVRASAPTGALN